MKFGIDLGHNCPFDGGAAGVRKSENQLILEVGNIVISKLKRSHQVVECRPRYANSLRESLYKRTQTANKHKVDRFVSIHFNAFNGKAHGVEVLYLSSAGKQIALPVLNEIAKLGYENRGLKYRNNLHVLKATEAPAILIECCFCDSWKDMNQFNAEKMAIAIVKGLLGDKSTPQCPACGHYL